MMTGRTLLTLIAGLAINSVGTQASAGWYIGAKHDAHYNARFLQRPNPPYHGWNRPFYGWSSNYRPYYFTPQQYANTPWAYGPCYHDQVYHTSAPPQGLNAWGVPVSAGVTTNPVTPSATLPPQAVPQAPTMAAPPATPTLNTPAPTPAVPEPPRPSL